MAAKGGHAGRLENDSRFLGRLQDARIQQGRQCQLAQGKLDQIQSQWQRRYLELNALQDLLVQERSGEAAAGVSKDDRASLDLWVSNRSQD